MIFCTLKMEFPMLVLSRKHGERILIGDNIVVTIVRVNSTGVVRVGIDAPKNIRVDRDELPPLTAEKTKDDLA